MPKNAAIEPWERQPNEGTKPFEAFCLYRDMGSERTLLKVSRQLGKSETLIQRWSFTHKWSDRCRAYDRHLDKIAHKTAIKEYSDMTKRHIRIAMKLQSSAIASLEKLVESKQTMKPRDIKEFIALGTELERLNRMLNVDDEPNDDDGFLDALSGIASEVNDDACDVPEDINPEE